MELQEKSLVACNAALSEAQRWIEAVTKKKFGSSSFRSSLENGVLLCELVNKIKPGIIKRLNRLSTPIAGLDNINIFLKACARLGLKEAQLFHPGDLQDLSTRVTIKHQETSRRLKNVLITIYWLGRKAQVDPLYNGPYLNLKAFQELIGTELYKASEDCPSASGSDGDSGFGHNWYSDSQEFFPLPSRHKREDSLDSLDSLGFRTFSTSSDSTFKGSSEGCGSDPEAELGFRMSENYRRSLVVTPKVGSQFNQFLPSRDKTSGYVPAPLRKKRAERNDDNRRSWASPMFTDEDGTFTRTKSLSDILSEENVIKDQYDTIQKARAQVKENEDKWQDDLTKWKNRRRSVNSDIVKKKEEREQIENLTTGSSTRRIKTFKEMEEAREGRELGSFKNRFSFSTSEDQDVFDEPTPRSRTLPPRSYTIDNPYSLSGGAAVPSVASQNKEELSSPEDSPLSPVPSSQDTSNTSQQSQTSSSSLLADPVPAVITSKNRQAEPTSSRALGGTMQEPTSRPKPAVSPVPEFTQSSSRLQEDQSPALFKTSSGDRKQPAVAQVSSSLPGRYQRTDSARLTSVVTPRPFGTQNTRLSSLPRAPMRFNGETENSDSTAAPRHYTALTKEDKPSSQGSSAHSSDEDEEMEEEELAAPAVQTISCVPQVSHVSPQPKAPGPVTSTQQENYSYMRISLNHKPKNSRDFGFQTSWDSTGAYVTSIQPGSPAEQCHLQMGDEILAVNGHEVADMSCEQWNGKMNEALQQGSLFMDIRRYGKNNWDRDLPSLPYKSHKTINLTSADALGSSVTYSNTNLDLSSQPAKDQAVKSLDISSQPAKDLTSNGVNGGIQEPVTLRKKGGAENDAILDASVPPVFTSSNRWSWDPEEERRRQEKWQKEQERLLQEKYRRDQEKMEEEFRKAQQEAVQEGTKHYEEEMRRLELEASREALQEQEERRRKEQESRHLEERRREQQERLEEEKRKREEQQRLEEERRKKEEQKRLEEERKKREEEEERQRKEDERRRREEEVQRLQRKREEEEKRRQEAQKRLQENDMDYGYTNNFPELSYSHRAKSKSTPELDEMEKTDIKVVSGGLSESSLTQDSQKKKEPLSQAELERQQILQEMKKKAPLLRDSSWIRQNSSVTSTSNEPVSVPMRRGESLDNLDTSRPSVRMSWAPGSTSSIPDYSRPQSALSGSTYRGGRPGFATLPASQSLGSLKHTWSQLNQPSNTNTEPENQAPRNRSVSGKKICTLCDMPLGKGAAMIIESLGLCYHLPCFKCFECKSDLGGSQAGAEVRIRNKQLYCNSCYIRFKNGQPTAM